MKAQEASSDEEEEEESSEEEQIVISKKNAKDKLDFAKKGQKPTAAQKKEI